MCKYTNSVFNDTCVNGSTWSFQLSFSKALKHMLSLKQESSPIEVN